MYRSECKWWMLHFRNLSVFSPTPASFLPPLYHVKEPSCSTVGNAATGASWRPPSTTTIATTTSLFEAINLSSLASRLTGLFSVYCAVLSMWWENTEKHKKKGSKGWSHVWNEWEVHVQNTRGEKIIITARVFSYLCSFSLPWFFSITTKQLLILPLLPLHLPRSLCSGDYSPSKSRHLSVPALNVLGGERRRREKRRGEQRRTEGGSGKERGGAVGK